MRLVPATIGAEPKKLAILGVLLAAAGVVYFINRDPSPVSATASPKTPPLDVRPAVKTVAPRPSARIGARLVEDFKPSLKLKEGVDISRVDPTLKLDLLAKVSSAGLDLGTRGSVFDWGKAPPPPPPVKIEPGKVAEIYGPMPPTPTPPPPTPPPSPPPPPIPLKFYGFSMRSGAKRAFFLDGDEIDVAGENEVIKNRYKVIRIGVNSVEMEDLNFKHQQTLPLIAELAG
ncbi:MAG TPA: hypothetical protein VKX39_17805 [Bryobacteraceae bacterium]|nr:hypothetical protein [Bryobacteraceae bacterium]